MSGISLPTQRVLALYQNGIQQHGGGQTQIFQPNVDCIEGAIGSAWFNTQMYDLSKQHPKADEPNIIYFAAYALLQTTTKHCFSDGNKRLGWSLVVEILAQKGLTVAVQDEEVVTFVLAVCQNELKPEQIASWIATRIIEI